MSINERVREVRKLNNLTLDKMGERLGVKKSVLSMIENGKSNITEQMTKSICREFHIRYLWLTQGIEPMEEETDSYIMKKIDDIMVGENETAKKVFKAFTELDEESWKFLEQIIKKIAEKLD